MDPRQVIIEPVVSEKSYALMAEGKYTFRVKDRAHKTQIKHAVAEIFDVEVAEVRTSRVRSKPKRRGVHSGKTRTWKKAIVELKPGHALFQTFYSIQAVPQIPSLNRYRGMGGSTSEMGAESAVPTIHAILDETGRPMVLMTHNTDIADGWEREADLDAYFQRFAWQAYSIGVNVMMWIMTR